MMRPVVMVSVVVVSHSVACKVSVSRMAVWVSLESTLVTVVVVRLVRIATNCSHAA